MADAYVPDRLFARLFQPWTLPVTDWGLAQEDWSRVDAITSLPWAGRIVDVGSGDGTLGAMVCSRNPAVFGLEGVESDPAQRARARRLWRQHRINDGGAARLSWHGVSEMRPTPTVIRLLGTRVAGGFDGALVCEVLEHLSVAAGTAILRAVKGVCRSGALVCVTVPDPDGSRWRYPGHITPYRVPALRAMLASAGFQMAAIRRIGRATPPIWVMIVGHA